MSEQVQQARGREHQNRSSNKGSSGSPPQTGDNVTDAIDRVANKIEAGVELAGALLGVDMSDDKTPLSTNAKPSAREIATPERKALPEAQAKRDEVIEDAEIVESPAAAPATVATAIAVAPAFSIRRSRNLMTNAIEFLVLGEMCHVACPTEAHAEAVCSALAAKLAEAKKAA